MIAMRDVISVLVVIAPLKCIPLVDIMCLVGPVVDNCRGLRVGEEPREGKGRRFGSATCQLAYRIQSTQCVRLFFLLVIPRSVGARRAGRI